MILKFSLVISLVCNKDTDIEALAPASVFHHCLVYTLLLHLEVMTLLQVQKIHLLNLDRLVF